jgi:AraC family transcriptional regulator of adaptative response/methylated-DNA-[protein]-cysteine methyltransferase
MSALSAASADPEVRTVEVVAAAIERLARDWQSPPDLDRLAAEAGLSAGHFQRLFKERVGISPKRFSQFVTLGHARRLLQDNRAVLDAALDLGLSGPSRLHDLFVSCEAVTPGEHKDGCAGLEVRFAFHDTPLGRALAAATPRGVCWLGFVVGGDEEAQFAEMRAEFPGARLLQDAAPTIEAIAGAFAPEPAGRLPPLHLRGTNFQIKVWQALLAIPQGQVATYEDVARAIGRPTSMRAVGNAVGANPVSVLVPCHRVIRKTGVLDNYRWGPARKRALLALEAGRGEPEAA